MFVIQITVYLEHYLNLTVIYIFILAKRKLHFAKKIILEFIFGHIIISSNGVWFLREEVRKIICFHRQKFGHIYTNYIL